VAAATLAFSSSIALTFAALAATASAAFLSLSLMQSAFRSDGLVTTFFVLASSM
jgi:hypothetical protein